LLEATADCVVWSVAILAALGAVPALVRLRLSARPTALWPAWQWLALTYSAPALVETACRVVGQGWWLGHARWLAATATLAPVVAVFGARRPHERAWRFVVLTFLLLLALPAVEGAALRGETQPLLHTAHRALVMIVAGAGWINYLFTRHALAATFWLAAEACWLGPWVMGWEAMDPAAGAAWGQVLFAAGLHLAVWRARRSGVMAPHDALWLEFRDGFGLVWAWRLLERYNTQSRRQSWGWRLGWAGFEASCEARSCSAGSTDGIPRGEAGAALEGEAADKEQLKPGAQQVEQEQDRHQVEAASLPAPARAMLAGALRRFVSLDAIATRLGSV